MSIFRLDWRGGHTLSEIEDAARKGIDASTSAAVILSKQAQQAGGSGRIYERRAGRTHQASAPGEAPQRDTGLLQGGTQMRPAKQTGRKIVGLFGVFNIKYAVFQELGTAKIQRRPFLRPAADSEWPKLRSRIKGYLP